MLVPKTIANYGLLMFCIIIESNSQKTFFSVLCTKMAAVTSGENDLLSLHRQNRPCLLVSVCTLTQQFLKGKKVLSTKLEI